MRGNKINLRYNEKKLIETLNKTRNSDCYNEPERRRGFTV